MRMEPNDAGNQYLLRIVSQYLSVGYSDRR